MYTLLGITTARCDNEQIIHDNVSRNVACPCISQLQHDSDDNIILTSDKLPGLSKQTQMKKATADIVTHALNQFLESISSDSEQEKPCIDCYY